MIEVRIYNVTDKTELDSVTVDTCPRDGDPIEIDHEMYYVCETDCAGTGDIRSIGVIPLVAKDPAKIPDVKDYINCLSVAHKRAQPGKGDKK
jgi:hypothetical protein